LEKPTKPNGNGRNLTKKTHRDKEFVKEEKTQPHEGLQGMDPSLKLEDTSKLKRGGLQAAREQSSSLKGNEIAREKNLWKNKDEYGNKVRVGSTENY